MSPQVVFAQLPDCETQGLLLHHKTDNPDPVTQGNDRDSLSGPGRLPRLGVHGAAGGLERDRPLLHRADWRATT
jgi:hypothetical protein